jgi:CheY-like chemotaxis protein
MVKGNPSAAAQGVHAGLSAQPLLKAPIWDVSSMTSCQPYSILITDDDPAARETLREIVAPHGYHTLMAESGEEAIELIRQNDVHLALMDMHLPRLSGLETIAIFRQIKRVIPAILITADQDDDLMRRALSEHAFCVLAKPVSRHVVIYVVHRAIEKFYN